MPADYWGELQKRLKPGRYQNWTAASGDRDSFFDVVTISRDRLEITGDDITVPRTITRAEFNTLAEMWPGYKDGLVLRKTLRDTSKNSVYIITLLHWIDP